MEPSDFGPPISITTTTAFEAPSLEQPLPHRATGLATARKVKERSCRLSSIAVDVNHQLLVLTALTQKLALKMLEGFPSCTLTTKHCKNKHKQLKEKYQYTADMLECSGFGWNHEK
ncbi:hypothetical protein Ahy_A04g019200 [Arachis hypogaea]|uniref:Myb/SANT-like domain-containing protein n=1 Tax=Arachis hypogaea TaxID=3818 RepID=A0A445DFH1_ARAHY|nr:hypothetical protein Ahy_A04g019200 [Arachis hypogaea]